MRYHFYDLQTGEFHGTHVELNFGALNDQFAVTNTPSGHRAIAGNYDRLSQKFDIATGALVDYQPPQPSPDHEWNAEAKRWQLTAAAAKKGADAEAARAMIMQLEASQHRVIREIMLGDPDATARLKDIEGKIQELRKQL
jgi:hypothetical protein